MQHLKPGQVRRFRKKLGEQWKLLQEYKRMYAEINSRKKCDDLTQCHACGDIRQWLNQWYPSPLMICLKCGSDDLEVLENVEADALT